jgi:PKD domain
VTSRSLAASAALIAALAAAVAALAGLAAPAGLAAQGAPARTKFVGGIVRDVSTGAHLEHSSLARSGRLPYGGGRVLHSNRTHLIFWQPSGTALAFDPGYEQLIEAFLSDVAADSHRTTNTYALSGQYSDAQGPAAYDSTYGGAVIDTDPLPPNGCTEPAATGPGWTVCLTDGQLESEIENVTAADHLPTSNHDIYFLVTPDGFGSCTDSTSTSCALGGSATGYCGYHSETSTGVLYAVIPFNAVPGHCQSSNPRPNGSSADPTISTISHEHNETVTDPDGDAWIDAQGDEEADLCLTNFGPAIGGSGNRVWNESIHGGHFFLQELWSDADNACEPRAKPDSLSFALSRASDRARSVSFVAHGADPEGRMVGFEWFFGDGRAAFGRRVDHTFTLAGTYRVLVRATDSWGNWSFADRSVRITTRPSG